MSKYNIDKFKIFTVALKTPFVANDEIDLVVIRKVVRYFCNKGVKQLYVCGSRSLL